MNAPLKILCTLIRCIDNEANAKIVQPKDILDEAQELLKPLMKETGKNNDGRLDTEGDQDEDYGNNGNLAKAINVRFF